MWIQVWDSVIGERNHSHSVLKLALKNTVGFGGLGSGIHVPVAYRLSTSFYQLMVWNYLNEVVGTICQGLK